MHVLRPVTLLSVLLATSMRLAADRDALPRSAAAEAVAIYVSPLGDDGWSGKLPQPVADHTDGPYKSLQAAQRDARRRLAAMTSGGAARRSVHVVLMPGLYELQQTLAFDEADSGAPGAPTVYEAQQPGTAVLSGGTTLTGARGIGRSIMFEAPAGSADDWAGANQLYVNGRRAVLAREPNEGKYWFVDHGLPGAPGAPPDRPPHDMFKPMPPARQWLAGLSAEDHSRAVLDVYDSWTGGRYRLAEIVGADALRIRPASSYPFLWQGRSQRFFIENIPQALDAPGEWIGDKNGIRYLPLPEDGEAMPAATLPRLDQLLTVAGSGHGKWVQFLTFRGLAFQHARYLTPAAGVVDQQAAMAVGAAVEVDNARRIVIEDCSFSHTGGFGVWLRGHVRDSAVESSRFDDLGAGGIKVGLPAQDPSDSNATGANRIDQNSVTDTGHVFIGAVAILLGQTWDNTVSHNLVADTTYSGISVGWKWGYGGATSGRNVISGNLLFDIGQGQLSDMAGIYTLGESPGTRIEGNVIREVRSYPGYGPGAWGIYNDEGSSDVLVAGNVVVGTSSGGYLLHYGQRDTVTGNLFALGDAQEAVVLKSDPGRTRLTFSGNILIPLAARPFTAFAAVADVGFGKNIVSGSRVANGKLNLASCGAGCAEGDWTVALGRSPKAITIGGGPPDALAHFAKIIEAAGPTATAKAMPRTVRSAVVAPVALFVVDVAGSEIGAQPEAFSYSPAGDSEAVHVAARPDAPAGKCLLFSDSPRFAHSYDPFAFAFVRASTGVSSLTFKLRIDQDSNFVQEWRDDSQPFRVGPSMRVTAGGVFVNGRRLAPMETSAWTSFRIDAPLGDGAGQWTLAMTGADGKTRTFSNLADGSPDWRRLDWIGFISDATTSTQLCLTGIELGNSSP